MLSRNILFVLIVIAFSCGDKKTKLDFPVDKRYWNAADYKEVLRKIRFQTPNGEKYPMFGNPETAPVINKLIDQENFSVILDDETLGLNYRSDEAQKFFSEHQTMSKVYSVKDRQDIYTYGMELVNIERFGLALQIAYFKLGNDNIIKEADDPKSPTIVNLITSNENTLFKNFNLYLDYVNKEDSFSEEELNVFADGIDLYFPLLFDTFENGDKEVIKTKAELMMKKSANEAVKKSLKQLIEKIEK